MQRWRVRWALKRWALVALVHFFGGRLRWFRRSNNPRKSVFETYNSELLVVPLRDGVKRSAQIRFARSDEDFVEIAAKYGICNRGHFRRRRANLIEARIMGKQHVAQRYGFRIRGVIKFNKGARVFFLRRPELNVSRATNASLPEIAALGLLLQSCK